MLKWPMSDKDLAFIKAASNNLATTQNDASFERQLIKAYNLAARRAWKSEITKLSDIPKEWQVSTTTSTGAWQTVSGSNGTYTWN